MALLDADMGSIARCLDLVSRDPDAIVDGFFERSDELAVADAADVAGRYRREEGFCVRLVTEEGSFSSSRDRIEGEVFLEALRRTARRMSQGMVPSPRLGTVNWPERPGADELADFPAAVDSDLRRRQLVFPRRTCVRRHRRWIQVVGRELVGDVETEDYYSVRVDFEGGRWGTLLPALDAAAATRVAAGVGATFRARRSSPVPAGRCDLLLGPSAAAVLLHEAAAHALEIDTLAVTGNPESALGFRFASEAVDLLDDPGAGPEGLRRSTDDEGMPVLRRWLLRGGVVEQPLADRRWAAGSAVVTPGAGRRQSRHVSPAPRSHHLELLPGTRRARDLVADVGAGLFAAEALHGRLDPASGDFEVGFAHGRRIVAGRLSERVGPFRLRGKVSAVLSRIVAVASDPVLSGAGWCAKGGQRLPVWSTTPAVLLAGVEVEAG